MANDQMKSVASLLLVLNFCMYAVVLGIGGWAMNRAIDHGFLIGPGFELPAHFSPIYFPMGNAATGFFVTFALIAGVVGAASVISGLNHIRAWNSDSLPAAASAGTIAWTLTLLAMGQLVHLLSLICLHCCAENHGSIHDHLVGDAIAVHSSHSWCCFSQEMKTNDNLEMHIIRVWWCAFL
ncbi:unnamed protein product [Linum tenue]|uniref:Uncharacterized protein n=1 Tax=Linum tenue TaxID=586396 RepID=A0AAV0N0N5_9ROSI|nr:unnamed protein product [Linum tenue]